MQLTSSLQLRVLLLCTAPFAFNTSYIHHRLIQNPVKRKDGALCEKKKKIVNDFQPLDIYVKSSILDV